MNTVHVQRSTISSFMAAVLFLIGCLFLYWAVEYWVNNNFDKGRYEITKIQPAGGGDTLALWKLDRRTGRLEYCNLTISKENGLMDEFNCTPAKVLNPEGATEVPKPKKK